MVIVKKMGVIPCQVVGIGFPLVFGILIPMGLLALGIATFKESTFGHWKLLVGAVSIALSGQSLYGWLSLEMDEWATRDWPEPKRDHTAKMEDWSNRQR
jgi:hypothetical protein